MESYKDKEFLTGSEFRKVLRISNSTYFRWMRAGKIKAIRLNPESERSEVRIPTSEIDRLLNESMNDKGE